jgi:hypothetical protein
MPTVKIQTSKNATWLNAAGDSVPFKFVPKSDKSKEVLAAKIWKAALSVEASLAQLHSMMKEAFTEVSALVKAEYELKNDKKLKTGKGSLTWFNFDRSIKVEADVNDIVKWDSGLMTEALILLNKYISANMTESNELISELVKSAFANQKGMIDTGKVFQLLRYEDKIKAVAFQKACELIKQAQSIDRTKLYMRVWEKQDDGSYRNINLTFSTL